MHCSVALVSCKVCGLQTAVVLLVRTKSLVLLCSDVPSSHDYFIAIDASSPVTTMKCEEDSLASEEPRSAANKARYKCVHENAFFFFA
jgi:hypothetical protein